MRQGSRAWLLRYGVVAGSVTLALLLTVLLQSWIERNVVVLFLAAVLFSTAYGGLGPGLLAMALTTLCSAYFLVPPVYSFGIAAPNDVVWLSVYVLVALTLSALTAARQRAVERLQEAHATLEERVHERTAQLTASNTLLQQEIEQHKQTEEALRESEERYRSLFENANDAIVTFTLEGIVTSVNQGLEVMLGWLREELIGQHFRKFVTPASVALGEERTRRFLAGEYLPSIFEGEHLRKDGTVVPVEVRTRAIRDREGQPIGFQGIYRDISARKQAEEALLRSAEHFRALVEQALDFVVVINRDGTVRYESPAVARMLGYTPEERVGRNGFEHIHPDDVPRVMQTFVRAIQLPGATVSLEFRGRHKDGSWRTLEAVGINLLEDPVVAGVVVNYRDITVRKQMEEALQQAHAELERRVQERTAELSHANAALQQEIANRIRAEHALQHERNLLQVTLASIGDAVIATDTAATLTFINPVAETLTGWTAREAIGRNIAEVFHIINEQTRQVIDNPVQKVLQEGRAVGLANHTVLIARDGREVPIADSGAPIQGTSGQVYGTVMVFRDITESKQAETALRRAKEAAEAADRIKSEFLATMSHELRTPLNVILGYTDMLMEGAVGDLPPQQVDILRRIDRNSRVLFELISMVLDLNRLEAGRLPVDVKEVQVAQFLAEIKAEMQGLCDQSGLACVWQVAAGLPLLHTDPGKLKVVIKNLLSNAVKFTKEGSITVTACERGEGIEIGVTDSGIGIAPDAQAFIFEPFRQVDSSDTRPYSGSGLGLHIVKRLLEVLGGTITVDSEVGRGSTFRVWVPTSIAPGSSSEGTRASTIGKG